MYSMLRMCDLERSDEQRAENHNSSNMQFFIVGGVAVQNALAYAQFCP